MPGQGAHLLFRIASWVEPNCLLGRTAGNRQLSPPLPPHCAWRQQAGAGGGRTGAGVAVGVSCSLEQGFDMVRKEKNNSKLSV